MAKPDKAMRNNQNLIYFNIFMSQKVLSGMKHIYESEGPIGYEKMQDSVILRDIES